MILKKKVLVLELSLVIYDVQLFAEVAVSSYLESLHQ